jgi:hypothetical protein
MKELDSKNVEPGEVKVPLYSPANFLRALMDRLTPFRPLDTEEIVNC